MTDNWVQTYSGVKFDISAPKPHMVKWVDIAHALSLQCRYNGHTSRLYSVAEHSLLVCRLMQEAGCHPKDCLQGLLHDAAEAYVGDVVSPLKQNLIAFDEAEERVLAAVLTKAGLSSKLSPLIGRYDLTALAYEYARFFWDRAPAPWEALAGEHIDLGPHYFIGDSEHTDIEKAYLDTLRGLLQETGRK